MLISKKPNLMKYLETIAVSKTPEVIHKTIFDAIFFLCLHVNLPNTFEAIPRYILGRIIKCEWDTKPFVCGKWIEPSIKHCEEEDRVSLRGIYSIKSPAQIRPSDWEQALKNKTFEKKSY